MIGLLCLLYFLNVHNVNGTSLFYMSSSYDPLFLNFYIKYMSSNKNIPPCLVVHDCKLCIMLYKLNENAF